jgi:hypothetical protein
LVHFVLLSFIFLFFSLISLDFGSFWPSLVYFAIFFAFIALDIGSFGLLSFFSLLFGLISLDLGSFWPLFFYFASIWPHLFGFAILLAFSLLFCFFLA